MGISKTLSGYLDGSSCEDADEWITPYGPPFDHNSPYWNCADTTHAVCIDTAEKHEGAASIRHLLHAYCPAMDAESWFLYFARTMNCGPAGGGAQIRLWHKATMTSGSAYVEYNGKMDSELIYSVTATEPWTLKKHTLAAGGQRTFYRRWAINTTPPYSPDNVDVRSWMDRIVICLSQYVTVTGLAPGQKVEVYRSIDDTKITEATCAAEEDHIQLDVDAEDFPEQMYMKVYATDGETLIETTSSYKMCGGDTWNWTVGAGTLTIANDAFIIYRSSAGGTPKTANITANLKTLAGEPYPNVEILFSTTLGTLDPSSDLTDASGDAYSVLSSTVHGIAVVTARWLGDANVPPCSAFCVVHVFYDAEVPDSSQGFQFYVQGFQFPFDSGSYGFNKEGQPETFEVEIPEWDARLVPNGLVNIYRKGVNEFAGILKAPERTLSEAPRVVLRGPDISRLLNDRVVDIEIYADKTPQYMISDLLLKYPCGVTPGVLRACPDTLTVTVDTESLLAVFQRICDAVFWHFHVNPDRTIDLAESFGGVVSAATFTEGGPHSILSPTTRTIDYTNVANRVRMRGGEALRSMKEDGTMIAAQGLLEAAAFQKTITDQDTLDTACQALLDLLKTQLETVSMDAVDDFPPGTFGPEDQVTVEAPSLGLSGAYTVKRIERDMSDPDFVRLDLNNRSREYWALDEAYRRMTKDANV